MSAVIYQINVKPRAERERGLPKLPVESAYVRLLGIDGDFNRYRTERKNNTPTRALLLYPLEMILQLQKEGWPVQPGDLGENITTQGISYDAFDIGKEYALGAIRICIEEVATPCKVLWRLSYVGQEKGSAFVKTLVGRRGWYARVLKKGTIRKGDTIEELLLI